MAGTPERLTAIVEDFLRHIEGGSGGTPEEFLLARGGDADPETVEVLSLLAQTRARPGSGGELGPYRLERELGRGAQGVVYLATDTRLGRKVALKVLAPHAAFGTEIQGLVDAAGIAETIGAVRRFRREVEVAARLDHPGICPVYEAGILGSTSFIAMRHVEGRTLADLIAEARGRDASASSGARSSVVRLPEPDPESSGVDVPAGAGGRTDIDRACLLVERAARALHVAHEKGLVHRDIKPGNLMVTPSGTPVVLDFGLARDVESGNLTRTGTLLGTPVYMSPEQIAVKEVDRRTDVYSLGVVLFECLALRRPFDAPTLQALCHEILTREPPRLRKLNPAVPPELAVVVETALSKERERRYRTAIDFAEDLRRARERLPIRARPPGPLLRLRRWAERSPALAASVVAIFVLLAAGLAVTSHLLRKTSRALVETERERDAKDAALRHTRALALAGAAAAELDADPMLSLLLAREATRVEPLRETLTRLHDAINRSTSVAILPHDESVCSVAFSPGGDILMSADGATIRLWDTDWKLVGSFPLHDQPVTCAAFSPAGDRILTASGDRTARVWDLAGNVIAILEGHEGSVVDAAFSPDGRAIATASHDRTARLWTAEGELLRTFVHEDWVWRVAFSPDGKRVASASGDGSIRIWGTHGNLVRMLRRPPGNYGLAFSRGGDRIAHLGAAAAVLDLDGQVIAPLARGGVRARFCANDTQVLVAEGWGFQATLWSVEGRQILVLRGHTSAVSDAAQSPDGRFIATASKDGTVRVWEPGRAEGAVLRGHESDLWDVSFSVDGSRIVTASADGTARVWRADGTAEIVLPQDGPVSSAKLSPSGDLVLAASGPIARLWRTDGTEVAALTGHEAKILHAEFSRDGRRIVTAADDGEARLWESDGRFLRAFRHPHEWVKCATFSPDGQRILTSCRDGLARVWSLDGRLLVSVRHEGHMRRAAFSPDGERFVTTSGDPKAYLWQADGKLLATCQGPSLGAVDAAFSPDGRTFATANLDGTARIYGLDGTELLVLRGHASAVTSAAFSPDGRSLVTASLDGTARIWHVAPDDLLRVAGERLLRDFTREERLRFADLLGPDNRIAIEAHGLVEKIAGELLLADEIAERIRSTTPDDAVRAHALGLAAELREDPVLMRKRAWFIVRHPGGDVARALRWAGRAAELQPEDGWALHVLGAALYRSGEHARAVEHLARA
ncbi:MAG: protein kinase, partial [Planctomycetes bacterium]|nr:protein kinase [Planctomycetota bacterium]